MTQTVSFHRVLRCPPERVYRAFTTPSAMAKWLPPHGFTGTVHEMDAQVGGRWRMSFTNLTTGGSHSFGGRYLELVPGERLRYTATFECANRSRYEEGDHVIFVGEVERCTHRPDASPLLFHGGKFYAEHPL